MFGRTHSTETKAKMRIPKTEEHKASISKAKIGENNPMYGRLGENNPNFGKPSSPETKAKISSANGTAIYVYSSEDKTLINTFSSASKAAEFFNSTHYEILKHARNNLIFKEQWILSTSIIYSDKKS